MKRIYFDIETGPRPEEELHALMPEFTAPANYTDPVKIAKVITEKKTEWLEKAALCATSGKVLAIGTRRDGSNTLFATGDEAMDLKAWWACVEQSAREGSVLVGFNIARFDIPYLIRRSWLLGVNVPMGVFNGRYLNHHVFIDLYEEWQCGDRGESISLKRLSEFLGVGTKDKDGAVAFAQKWVTDRKAAIAYLENDLVLTEAVATKLLGPWPPVSSLPAFVTPGAPKSRAKKHVPPDEAGKAFEEAKIPAVFIPKTETPAAPTAGTAAPVQQTAGSAPAPATAGDY